MTSLGSLVAKSLVDVVPNLAGQRFVMLETVREYAAELLGEPDEAGLRVAHARHIRDHLYADHRGAFWPPRNVEELAKWTAELPNARAAIAFANREGDVQMAADLVVIIGNLWHLRAEWTEMERHTTWLLGQTGITTERRLELYDFAFMSQLMSDSRRAQATIDEGLALAAESGQRHPAQEAYLLLAASNLAYDRGDIEVCRSAWARAMVAAQEAGDRELLGYITAFEVGPISLDDLPRWDAALRSARETGNLMLEEVVLNNMSESAIGSMDPAVIERGVAAGLDGRDVAELVGDVGGQAVGLGNAGAALLLSGSPKAAAEHLRAALVLGQRLGYRTLQVEILLRLAAAESAMGQEELAHELFASWYALGESWTHGVSPANQRLIDTLLPELWAARESMPVTDVSLSDAVDLALRDHAPT